MTAGFLLNDLSWRHLYDFGRCLFSVNGAGPYGRFAASSNGFPTGGSGVDVTLAAADSCSRLFTSSCCLCGNRWEYVFSVVDTFSCPSLSERINASLP